MPSLRGRDPSAIIAAAALFSAAAARARAFTAFFSAFTRRSASSSSSVLLLNQDAPGTEAPQELARARVVFSRSPRGDPSRSGETPAPRAKPSGPRSTARDAFEATGVRSISSSMTTSSRFAIASSSSRIRRRVFGLAAVDHCMLQLHDRRCAADPGDGVRADAAAAASTPPPPTAASASIAAALGSGISESDGRFDPAPPRREALRSGDGVRGGDGGRRERAPRRFAPGFDADASARAAAFARVASPLATNRVRTLTVAVAPEHAGAEELDARLRKAADRARVSMGAWVRQAIEERLDRQAAAMPSDPLAALRALEGPTADIDEMLAEIERGRA